MLVSQYTWTHEENKCTNLKCIMPIDEESWGWTAILMSGSKVNTLWNSQKQIKDWSWGILNKVCIFSANTSYLECEKEYQITNDHLKKKKKVPRKPGDYRVPDLYMY